MVISVVIVTTQTRLFELILVDCDACGLSLNT